MKRLFLALLLLVPLPSLACDIEVAFSPDRGATDLVVRTIESAKTSVRVAAYSFTSKPIAEALMADSRRGVDVEVVVDGQTVETGSFNLTAAAEHRNAENLIVLKECPEVAKRYADEWQRLWEESEPIEAADHVVR